MFFRSVLERWSREILCKFLELTLCICGRVLESRFFIERRRCCSLLFFLALFFIPCSFSLFCAISFSVFLVRTRFQPNSSDIGLARLPIKPLTGTDSVDGTFFDFSALTCFQSDRADIGLPRPPIGVLTSTNVPWRYIRPKYAVFVRQFLGCCFLVFWE